MESQKQVQPEENGGSSSKSSFLCRQSSTRWIPTAEQIRILREIYYNNGVRSPNAEQIQRISARLRQYGKIEGKNVFYWFQNHKARERQKKRLAADMFMHAASPDPAADEWSSCDEASSKLTSISSSSVNGNSSGCESAVAVGQLNATGSGSLFVERENPLEREGFSPRNTRMNETGADWYEFFSLKDSGETSKNETETLQLFPLGNGNDSGVGFEKSQAGESCAPWYLGKEHGTKSHASLELTLGTFGGNDRDSGTES